MGRLFIPGTAWEDVSKPGWWFAFVGNQLLVRLHSAQPEPIYHIPQQLSLTHLGLQPIRTQFLGILDHLPCYSAELPLDAVAPAEMELITLRSLYGQMDEDLFDIAGRAFQIMEWDRTHQYCGACATPMMQAPQERAKRCPNCGLVNYPRLSPAVIVLISRGDEILLARAPRFPEGMYSILAGFVEPGESLEEATVREVREEAGIEIRNLRYFGSQPWPYPNSLMIGFTAEYAGGEIVLDPTELVDAGWFHKRNLPLVPARLSIARKLIDWFVAQE